MKIAAFNVKNLEISKASDDVRRNLIKVTDCDGLSFKTLFSD